MYCPRHVSSCAHKHPASGQLLVADIACHVQIREGLYYNPYFPGGAIAMPKMLADEGAEYDDGTVATEAQQAKVTCVNANSVNMCSIGTVLH